MVVLRTRAAALARIREFFSARGSLEVETPALVASPGVDAHLDAIEATLRPGGVHGTAVRQWLRTSPEYHMKRLLAAGSGSIFQLGKAWRDGEVGDLHEPEFTMLEWYSTGLNDWELMNETEELVRDLAAEFGGGRLRTSSMEAVAEHGGPPFDRITFRSAFLQHTGLDPETADPRSLGRMLRASGTKPPGQATREDLVDLLLGCVVQPQLGQGVPVFVTDWPTDRAGLAQIRPGRDPDKLPAAARFELYACGIELCNGYHELTDAAEQQARIDHENRRRLDAQKEPYPMDEHFLDALRAGLPQCAGNALGVDRLLLLLLGLERLSQVRCFTLESL
ncbi:MAG TPA: hypothetical protein DIU15_11440 [Deltaproteobacteria bacterium]|nr:hypothetical protein [Deltaproteobacteria bacterium]HCP46651.1 hypothetical protein [Deltaproteobacteria bacterium]